MPIYNFEFDSLPNPLKLVDQRYSPKDRDGNVELRPAVQPPILEPKRDTIWNSRQNVNVSEQVNEILPIGYRTMDRGIKNYFSGMQIPTMDDVKMMQVRVSGGDKPYLVWAQDLRHGRVTLPVMSISRTKDDHYPPRFSPAHFHYMAKRFVDSEGSKIALTYRPVSSLIEYTLSVWAEHKRDLEYIHAQIRRRFNPIAEFFVEDEYLRGGVILKYNGMTSAVDEDVPADQRQNKRYDYSISMEGWIPLPEKVVPTILGRVTTLKDMTSREVLMTLEGKDGPIATQLRR